MKTFGFSYFGIPVEIELDKRAEDPANVAFVTIKFPDGIHRLAFAHEARDITFTEARAMAEGFLEISEPKSLRVVQ